MNRNILLHIIFIVLLNSPLALAQPSVTVTPADVITQKDEFFDVNIVTKDFINMTNTSLSVNWDPMVIELDTYFIFLPDGQLFINDVLTGDGKFAMIWNDATGTKPSFDDETIILTLKFKAIENGFSPVDITDTPTTALMIYEDKNGVDIETSLIVNENGTITVGTNSITSQGLDLSFLQVKQNTPNPFTEYTLIPFELTKPEYLKLNILNLDGKSIFQYSNQYDEGTHFIRLEKEVFPTEGVYLYQIKTSNSLLTKKLILVR